MTKLRVETEALKDSKEEIQEKEVLNENQQTKKKKPRSTANSAPTRKRRHYVEKKKLLDEYDLKVATFGDKEGEKRFKEANPGVKWNAFRQWKLPAKRQEIEREAEKKKRKKGVDSMFFNLS
jgi:hypothetical protein